MTTNLVESFNAWLKNKGHHSICSFLMGHMIKLGVMLVKHKEESNNKKGSIGPKIEEKVLGNIAKGEGHLVYPFMNSQFGVSMDTTYVNVHMGNRTCTCKAWQMSGIPCEHVYVVILSLG